MEHLCNQIKIELNGILQCESPKQGGWCIYVCRTHILLIIFEIRIKSDLWVDPPTLTQNRQKGGFVTQITFPT